MNGPFALCEVSVATSNKKNLDLKNVIDDEELDFSSSEDAVFRLREGIAAKPDKKLKRKTDDPELLQRLLELERAIIKRAEQKK